MSNENYDTLIGKWQIIKPQFKHLPVHLTLLHTGEILGFAGSLFQTFQIHMLYVLSSISISDFSTTPSFVSITIDTQLEII